MPSALALPFSLPSVLLLPLSRLPFIYLRGSPSFSSPFTSCPAFICVFPLALAHLCSPSPYLLSAFLLCPTSFCLGPGPSFLLLPVPLRSALLLHLSHLSSLIFFPSVLAPFLSLVLPLLSAPPLPQPHPFSLGVYSLDTSPSPDRFFLFTFPPLLLLCSSSAFCLALLYSFLHTAALLFWWLPSVPASSCHSLCPPGISWSSLRSPNSRPLFSGISSLL